MRWPAEWEPHERTLMGWPCRRSLWRETIEAARADYAAVANAIAEFEPVTMITADAGDATLARRACSGDVEIVGLPLDDSWLRDCGPIYVYGEGGTRCAVHFRFNAWGEKYPPWERDAEVGGAIAQRLGDEVRQAPLVLEGGSILGDGAGTLVTTEQCLLNPNRNPALSRDQIEEALRGWLGVERIVWLGMGLVEDRDTDGHVDLIAAFTRPDQLLLQTVAPGNPNFGNCEENRARLRAAGIDVLEMPFLPYTVVVGETVAASYMNLYLCNGAVIVPVCGDRSEADALALIGEAFAGREVVPVPGAVLAYGGGGPHCITQPVPLREQPAGSAMR
jgi:agmatine deiminase